MSVSEAAALIRAGKLVAFPTETVYGLGANALDARAVAKIFELKGRPYSSPLIVHVDSPAMARSLARDWPEAAEKLAARYWPGPLTLVLPKAPAIPDIVTAGLDTVGLRMPSHPLALELIREAGVPIAAPSANRFGELSPTTADHVRKSLSVEHILDGGRTSVGIESTVLSLAGIPELLRPGTIPLPQIEAIIGPVALASTPEGAHASPGMHPRHYSPKTPLILGQPPREGQGVYLRISAPIASAQFIQMPSDPIDYAAILYETLHKLDEARLDWIAVEPPPQAPEWAGISDRLRRAAKRKAES